MLAHSKKIKNVEINITIANMANQTLPEEKFGQLNRLRNQITISSPDIPV